MTARPVPKSLYATSYFQRRRCTCASSPATSQPVDRAANQKLMNLPDHQDRMQGLRTALLLPILLACLTPAQLAGQQAAPSSKVLGTVQTISGKSLTVLSDSGTASAVSI